MFKFLLFTIVFAAGSALAGTISATRSTTTTPHSLNPDPSTLQGSPGSTAGFYAFHAPVEPRSNAERFALGLPPLPPKNLAKHLKRHSRARRHHQPRPSNTPSRPQPSGYLLSKRECGSIKVDSGSSSIGYVSMNPNKFGEYNVVADGSQALTVCFSPSDDASPVDVTVTNGPFANTFKYFGAVQGYASTTPDLGSGSFNYEFLAGTSQASTSQNAANSFTALTGVTEASSSTIWIIDKDTGLMTIHYSNPSDKSTVPDVKLVYLQDTIVFTGDLETFEKNLGKGTVVTFKFVKG